MPPEGLRGSQMPLRGGARVVGEKIVADNGSTDGSLLGKRAGVRVAPVTAEVGSRCPVRRSSSPA